MKKRINWRRTLAVPLGFGLLGASLRGWGQLITSDPSLPPVPPALPPNGGYTTAASVHATYGSDPGTLQIILSQPLHRPLAVYSIMQLGQHQVEGFNSLLTGTADIWMYGVLVWHETPLTANGPVETLVQNKYAESGTEIMTGTFQTEMLSLNLAGSVGGTPFLLRENPTLQSLGQTTVTDIGGGLYRIDSFFDVFTELSLDGGSSWIPNEGGPTHMTLVPEPSGYALGFLGATALPFLLLRRGRLLRGQ